MKLLLYLVLVPLLCLSMASAVFGQEIFREKEGSFTTRQLRASAPVAEGNHVIIKSVSTLTGKLTIVTADTNVVTASYFKKSKADTKSKAIDYIDLIAVDLDRTVKGAQVILRAPNPAPWSAAESGSVELELTVPEKAWVEIDAAYFDVDAEGPFTGLVVPSSLGRLEVVDVDGTLELATSNRRVSVADITGSISVSTSNSTLLGRNLRSSGRQATIRNNGGDVRIDRFVGEISLRNTFGRIELLGFEPTGRRNVIRGRSAPVVVEIVSLDNSQVVVNNHHEDIDITVPSDLSAALSLAVEEGGKIEVGGLKLIADLVQRDRLSLQAGDGEGMINGSTRGRGNIFVRGIGSGE